MEKKEKMHSHLVAQSKQIFSKNMEDLNYMINKIYQLTFL